MKPMHFGIRIDDGVSCTYLSERWKIQASLRERVITADRAWDTRWISGLKGQGQGSRIGQQPGGSPGATKEPDYRAQGQRTRVGRL